MIFEVAVWRVWSCGEGFISLPEIAVVEAPNAFTAVVGVMRLHGMPYAGHVAAAACDGSLVYRADGVWLGVAAGGDQASLRA